MRRACVPAVAMLMAVSGAAEPDPWASLRVLEGKWQGPSSGEPGQGVSTREFRFELNGMYLSEHDKTVWEPKSEAAKPQVHEDFGWFSYDRSLKKIVWRQFHSEGFVNEYTLDTESADGKPLEFVTERMENSPSGWRAKESFQVLSADEVEATFFLARPGKGFEIHTRTLLKRVK